MIYHKVKFNALDTSYYHSDVSYEFNKETVMSFIDGSDTFWKLKPLTELWEDGFITISDSAQCLVSYDYRTQYGVFSVMGSIQLPEINNRKSFVYASCDNPKLPLFMSKSLVVDDPLDSLRESAEGIVEDIVWLGEDIEQSLDEVSMQVGEGVMKIGYTLIDCLEGTNDVR